MNTERKLQTQLQPQAIIQRPIGLLVPNRELVCSNGHKIHHRAWAPGKFPMLAERCDYREPPGNSGECGAIVYWLKTPGGIRIVKELSSSEAHEMESQCMDIEQLFNFIAPWPPV